MSKIIFLLKIFLVGDRFPLSDRHRKAIKILVKFVLYIYAYFWFACPVAQDAPSLTLQLWTDLQKWSEREKRLLTPPKDRVALTCVKKLDRHTWYLSPRHVVFALWSDKVGDEDKAEMAQNLLEQLRNSQMSQTSEGASGGNEDNNDCITEEFSLGKPDLPRIYEDSSLSSFIERDSLLLFQVRFLIHLLHSGSKQPRIWKKVPGLSPVCSLVRSHRSFICFVARSAALIHSLTHSQACGKRE